MTNFVIPSIQNGTCKICHYSSLHNAGGENQPLRLAPSVQPFITGGPPRSMISRIFKVVALSFPLLFLFPGAALADTCNDFATFTCAKSTPNTVHVGGGVPSGQSVGVLLTGNTFNISTS